VTWSRPFDDPIVTPAGKKLLALKDAAAYIRKLPKKEQDADHWQVAVSTLIMAAEDRGPLLHAAIAMHRALAHGRPDTTNPPRRKAAKKYKIVR
jgi:hypothetical protein